MSDHTSCLQFVEAVAAAGGRSGTGPIRFPNISRWRRRTFSNLTGGLVPGAPRPAPSNSQFDPSVRAAELAAPQASSTLPRPPFPGAAQTLPVHVR